jgi:glycosyltransferase involved in cell wall biosynthesis
MNRYSIIVPHYNDTDRLARLLASIPINDNIEVIVVDDCSTDVEKLELVKNDWSRVKWLSTNENSGAGVARNIGIDSAQGDWIIFADSDDLFLPDAFCLYDENLKNDDQLVYFLAEGIQERSDKSSVRSEFYNHLVTEYIQTSSSERLLRLKISHVVPWAKVYSLKYIVDNNLRFDPTRYSNDVAFNVMAAVKASKVRAIAKLVYRVYRRDNSLTSEGSSTVFFQRFLVKHSLAMRLAEMGITNVIPSCGYILKSMRYSPALFIRVFSMAIFSPMQIRWWRIFNFSNWKDYIKMKRILLSEIKNSKSRGASRL